MILFIFPYFKDHPLSTVIDYIEEADVYLLFCIIAAIGWNQYMGYMWPSQVKS